MTTTTTTIARILATRLDTKTLAAIIDGLLCIEDDDSRELNSNGISVGAALFDRLCEICPNAVELAQGLVQEADEAVS